jgi:hypothetical protein
MTSLHAIATSELRRVGEENEELKIKISLANSSMQLLREQVEELERCVVQFLFLVTFTSP